MRLIMYVGTLPQVYSDLPYNVHTVTVQGLSDSSSITIVEKGE